MIVAGEVGAVFTVKDEAGPVLRALMDQFLALQGAIDKVKSSLLTLKLPPGVAASIGRVDKALAAAALTAGKLDGAMAGIGNSADAGAVKAALGFGKIDGSIAATQTKLASLQAQLRQTGAGMGRGVAAAGVPGASSMLRSRGTGGGGGGVTGPHVTGPSMGLPGGNHASFGSAHGLGALGLGVAGAVGYGIYEEGEIEDVIARMILTGQVATPKGMTNSDAFKQIREAIQATSEATGVGPQKAGEAFLTVERQFGAFDLDKRVALEKAIAPYAAAEARMKESDFGESFEALVGLAHMTGTYDPEKLPELLRQFSYASLITPASIPRFRNALSYSMPMLHAGLDMDPSSIMFLTAMMQTAGINNTKSGTWLRSFFEGAEPRIGESKTDLAHNEALRRMGMLDEHDKPTWQIKGPDGKTNWDASILKMSEALNKFTQSTDAAERLGLLRQGFGERGGGFGALMNLPQFIDQFAKLQEKMKTFGGGTDVLDYLAKNSPVQQTNLAWAQLQNVLTDIGTLALPAAIAGLGGLRDILNAIKAGFDGKDPLVNFFTKPHLKADGTPEYLDSIGGGISSAKAAPANRLTRSDLPYLNNQNLQGIGAPPPPPPVVNIAPAQVDVKAETHVTLDGASIAAAVVTRIERMIESAFTMPHSSAGTDGRANHMPPDSYNF